MANNDRQECLCFAGLIEPNNPEAECGVSWYDQTGCNPPGRLKGLHLCHPKNLRKGLHACPTGPVLCFSAGDCWEPSLRRGPLFPRFF